MFELQNGSLGPGKCKSESPYEDRHNNSACLDRRGYQSVCLTELNFGWFLIWESKEIWVR